MGRCMGTLKGCSPGFPMIQAASPAYPEGVPRLEDELNELSYTQRSYRPFDREREEYEGL